MPSFEERYAQATALAAARDFEAAAAAYRAALALRPRDLASLLSLGLMLQAQDRLGGAVEAYRAALDVAPGFAEAHLRLGTALCQQGDSQAGVSALRRAIALAPRDVRPQVELAQALVALGDRAGAESVLRRACELEPAHTQARAHLLTLLSSSGENVVDYAALVQVSPLGGIAGWSDSAAFNEQLARCIHGHPTLTRNPPAAATRGGSQTLEIFDGAEPAFAALRRALDERVADYSARVLPRAAVPALAAWQLRGWAVVLSSGGRQLPHFHPGAAVSGVYYVQVPPSVAGAQAGEAGFLRFAQGEADVPSFVVRPEQGRLVLFPSYLLHHTVAFEAAAERISIAFDVVRAPR